MTGEKYDYNIFDYISQHFGMIIGETITRLSCHKKAPQIIKICLIYSVI